MNWRVVAASEVGTSHISSGRPCEDSCWAQVDTAPDGTAVLSMFVADGAGTAMRGGDGAELAVNAAAEFVLGLIQAGNPALDAETLAPDLVSAVRSSIQAKAEAEGLSPRDFSCTFLGLLSSAAGTRVLQVGDGGIVVDLGEGLQVPIAPMNGEYANMTHFVTQDDALDVLATEFFSKPAQLAAVFSDGLQRLALRLADNTAHGPFFEPFFKVMLSSSEDQQDQLSAALSQFLASERVNERTDDDKSLALATLVP